MLIPEPILRDRPIHWHVLLTNNDRTVALILQPRLLVHLHQHRCQSNREKEHLHASSAPIDEEDISFSVWIVCRSSAQANVENLHWWSQSSIDDDVFEWIDWASEKKNTYPMCADQLTTVCLENLCADFFCHFVEFQTISNGDRRYQGHFTSELNRKVSTVRRSVWRTDRSVLSIRIVSLWSLNWAGNLHFVSQLFHQCTPIWSIEIPHRRRYLTRNTPIDMSDQWLDRSYPRDQVHWHLLTVEDPISHFVQREWIDDRTEFLRQASLKYHCKTNTKLSK